MGLSLPLSSSVAVVIAIFVTDRPYSSMDGHVGAMQRSAFLGVFFKEEGGDSSQNFWKVWFLL